MNYKLFTRIVLFLSVYLSFSVNSFAWDMTPDWDGDNRESYVDETKAPGLEQIVRKWYRGKDYETNLTIPKTSCKYYTDSTSLNEVKLIDYNLPQNIEIGYGNFAIVVKRIHDGYDNQSDNSGLAFRNLQMVQSVEYSFGDGKWYKLDHIAANSPFSINLEEYEQNQRYPINNKKFVVRFQDFFEEEVKDKPNIIDDYINNGEIEVKFRFVYCLEIESRNNSGKDVYSIEKFYFHTPNENVLTLKIYQCNVGELSVDETKNPSLGRSEDGLPFYAIYPKQSGSIDVTSDISYNAKSQINDVISYNEQIKKSIPIRDNSGTFELKGRTDKIGISNFYTNQNLNPGDIFTVKREVEVRNVGICKSPAIKFKVVDPVHINSDADTSYQIECYTNKKDEYVTIYGEDLSTQYDVDLYKPEYRWEGKKGEYYAEKVLNQYEGGTEFNSDGSLRENGFVQVIEDEGTNKSELRIPNIALEEGKTYYFRQRVYLKGFGKDIYERGEKVYAVKIAKKFDPKKLKLNIDTNGVRFSKVCYGEYLDNVTFSATYGDENENPEDYNLEKFSFNYEIAGQKNSSTDKVNQSGSFNFENNIIFKVVMKNGCGDSIIKYDSITVQSLPVLSPNNIVKVNSDVEVEYFDDYVQVTGISGRECKLTIDDKEFSVHDYFYYQQGGKETKISPNMRTYFQSGKQEFFVYKKDKNGNGCKSNEIKVIVIGRENIRGNRFIDGLDTIYVCPGSNVPTLNDSHITIPEAGDNIEFSYKWIYSTNGYTYLPVRNVVGDETILITEPNLSDWKQIINSGESVHIKRVVSVGYNLEDPDNPTILGSDTSNAVVVTTFSDPRIGLELSGDLSDDGRNYCHGDTVILKGSVSAKFDGEYAEMRRFFNYPKYEVSYYDYVKEEGEYSYVGLSGVDKDGRFVMEGNHNIHAGVTYCGGTVYTEGSRSVSTLGRLDLVPIVGNCVILGDSVSVTAALDGAEVAIVRGDTLAHGNGTATAMLYVDKLAELRYHVLVRDDATGCGARLEKSIPASSVEKRLEPSGIGVEGLSSVGSVCAGSELTIGGKDVYMDGRYASFSWSVDGLAQIGERGRDFVYTFGKTSESYLVERTANYHRGGEFCYSVTDSVRLSTYPGLEEPVIELSDDAVCHGGEVVVKITAKGGGQGGEYKVMFSPGDISAEESVREGDSISHTFGNLTKNEQFYVSLSDAVCSSSMYNRISEKKLVKVDKDLSFSVSTASEIITLEDFKDNAIKIPFNFDVITTGDSMSYRVNGGKEVMFMYDGTALSLTLVDSTDFASGNVHLDFVHYGSVAGCSSEIVGYDISINEGFDGIPNITSAGIEDTIEVCAGTEVEMELSGLDDITFDEKPIEEMTDGVWTWYRNNSPVAGGSADGCVVKAEAGKSKTYYARFSAKDAGGKTRRLWSNPFTVIGKAPIKLEKIKFDNYQSQDFVEFCKGSDAKVTIASSQTFGKEVTLQWQYSENTADWTDVPASWNGGVQTVGVKSISVPVSVLGDKTTWFRLSVTDTCGQLAESNLLKVQFKGDVLSPSPVLTSTRIYDSKSDIPVALEFARSMNHSPYRFLGATDDEGELEVSEVGGRQSVGHKDGSIYKWSFGENIVRAVGTALARVSNEVCYSDTVEYKFRLFQKLGTPQLSKNPAKDTFFCPGDADMKFLNLHKIVGGDSLSYKTYWQYSMDDVNWYAVREGDNDGLFSADIKAIEYNAGEEYMQLVNVSHLKQTISFRAIVDCEGGYPGTSVVSDMTQTFRVYKPMLEGGIVDGEVIACYGSYPDSIRGLNAILGSGKYTFAWQWSKDDENWKDIPECTGQDFGLFAGESDDKYRLTESTYFRRVVTDAVCGTKSVSTAKHIMVKPEYLMSDEYFTYSGLVQSGNSAWMQGHIMDPQLVERYVWYRSENISFASSEKDSTIRGEVLEVPNGEESMKVTYYVQGIMNGCPTTNKVGFDVLVFNQSGGDIMFEGESETTSKKIICSGEDDIALQSVSAAPNVKFRWMYSINGGTNNRLYTKKAVGGAQAEISTESVRLDTTNLSLLNESGVSRTIRLYRNSIIEIEGETQYLTSDTLTLQIVPTLQSVGNTLELDGAFSLAGKIEVAMNKSDYCIGEQPNSVLGGVDVSSSIFAYWQEYRTLFGPWLYDNNIKGGFKTYYEYSTDYESDSVTWTKAEEYDFEEGKYAGIEPFIVTKGSLEKSYKVHRVLTDGCTTAESNSVFLRLFDKAPIPDSISSYAYTPEMTNKTINYAIKTGYEIGDSVVFENGDKNAQILTWFKDPECTDTLNIGKAWSTMVLDSASLTDNGAFIYVKATRGDCFGEAVAVPFEYGTLSNGGRIVINDTIICQNGMYEDILSEAEADGWYVVPQYQKMQWRYSWQYKWSDSKTARWSDIAGVNTIGLSSEVINSYVKAGSPLYIRRVAVNEKGRVRYSNELRLTHYTALVPGSLIAGDKLTFCTYDELPYVKTTSASGGKVSSIYVENWQYSVNGGPWSEITVLDSLYLGRLTTDLDQTINNEVAVRCLYSDDCDTVSSEKVIFTFYRYNIPPTIYQNNDSCNSTVVKLAVYQEELSKSYRWSALYVDPSDPEKEDEIWFKEGENCTVVRSHLPTSNFGVKSTDLQTGCVSEYFRFNVDSLPELEQALPIAPLAVCPGEDLTIKGGALRGGNSDKSYRWQLSATGNEEDYSDIAEATSENMLLESKYIKSTIYVRRIVEDMCSIDTSASVKVELRDKVEVKSETLILNDYKCENSTYTVKLNVEKDSSYASEFWVLGTDTLTESDKLYQMVGFEGESQELSFARYLTDSTGLTCSSEAITIVAHNKPAIDSAKNKISTENLLPCNESYVEISGENQGDEHITYKWFINGVEQIGKTSASLSLRAADTMLINRVMTNGCEKLSSDTIVLAGQRVYDYYYKKFDIDIVTQMQDSSVTLNISKSNYVTEDFYFIGDGIMPEVTSNNVVLPYNCEQYKDSVLDLQVIYEYCVRPLSITPLRGGTISFDGDTVLCGGADVPAIVVTEISGGSAKDEIKYQWQYKNIYTPDFINIDGATNKTYVPQAIDVETVYRRVTTNGIYSSISNELTLSIQPLPSVLSISNNLSKEEMKKYGLNYGKGYFEWLSSISTYLIVNAEYADELTWEKSMDGVSWVKQSVGDSIEITDSTEVVYYRLIASSFCGKDTSDVIKMISRFIDPINGELQNLKPNCYSKKKDDESFVFKVKIQNDKPQHKYSISIESECDGIVARKLLDDYYYFTSSYGELILVAYISQLKNGEYVYPPCDFTLNLTRHDTLYGLSISESFFIHINTLEAAYSIEVENGEEFRVGEKETILLAQGNRVQFREKVSENYNGNKEDLSYQWVLEEPLNITLDYMQHGGRMGLNGLTSELENPSCYYYNGGRYPMKLVVTDGECTSEIRDTSLYLPEESVRSRYNKSFALEGSLDYVEVIESEYVDVNPRLITDHVIVSSTNPTNVHYVKLVDELSREVWNGSFSGSLKIQTENLISGVYFIIVDETKIYKLIKK
jgi:hypothetical protein